MEYDFYSGVFGFGSKAMVLRGTVWLALGLFVWALPKTFPQNFDSKLKEYDSRIAGLQKAGEKEKAKAVLRRRTRLRFLSSCGLGLAIAGAVLIIIGELWAG